MGKKITGLQTTGILLGALFLVGGLGGYLWASSLDGKPIAGRIGYYYSVSPQLYAICVIAMIIGVFFLVAGIISYQGNVGSGERSDTKPYKIPVGEEVRAIPYETCPFCNCKIGASYIRCPYCANLLNKKCPGCKATMPLSWLACPTCGYMFPQSFRQPSDQSPIDDSISEDRVKVKPINAVALGRCPNCGKIIVEQDETCIRCDWRVDRSGLKSL
jgi:predicted RNA-binding Zn-ribbon protein involved in translation (DUF1610 family)